MTKSSAATLLRLSARVPIGSPRAGRCRASQSLYGSVDLVKVAARDLVIVSVIKGNENAFRSVVFYRYYRQHATKSFKQRSQEGR